MDKKKNEDVNLHVRITQEMNEELNKKCRISGHTKSGYVKSLLYRDLLEK